MQQRFYRTKGTVSLLNGCKINEKDLVLVLMMRQKRNCQRSMFEVIGKHPGPKELEQMSMILDTSPDGERLELPKISAFDVVQSLKVSVFLRESINRYYIGFMANEVGKAYAQD